MFYACARLAAYQTLNNVTPGTLTNRSIMKGDTMLPIRDIMKEIPTPRLLTSVGKSSLEKKMTVWKPPVMAIFPMMAKATTVLVYTEGATGGGGG